MLQDLFLHENETIFHQWQHDRWTVTDVVQRSRGREWRCEFRSKASRFSTGDRRRSWSESFDGSAREQRLVVGEIISLRRCQRPVRSGAVHI